jgi:hypothetical protein
MIDKAIDLENAVSQIAPLFQDSLFQCFHFGPPEIEKKINQKALNVSGLVEPIIEQSLRGVFFETEAAMSLPRVLSTDFTKEDGQWKGSGRVSFLAIFLPSLPWGWRLKAYNLC